LDPLLVLATKGDIFQIKTMWACCIYVENDGRWTSLSIMGGCLLMEFALNSFYPV